MQTTALPFTVLMLSSVISGSTLDCLPLPKENYIEESLFENRSFLDKLTEPYVGTVNIQIIQSSETASFELMKNFAQNILTKTVDIPNDIQKVVNENFWNWI